MFTFGSFLYSKPRSVDVMLVYVMNFLQINETRVKSYILKYCLIESFPDFASTRE